MLRLRLLGGLALEADGRVLVAPASRPARELLAWLALHPGPHTRLEVASRFWPDMSEPGARANLRTTLHALRRAECAAFVRVDRERIGLGEVEVDVHTLRGAELVAAGELLPGLDREWVLAARDEHADRVAAELAALADGPDGLRWAREAVKRDPLSEDATRRLMTLLAASGDRAAAMAAYVRLEDRLDSELSVTPSRETRRVLAELRVEPRERPPLPPALASRGGPLAGRGGELARLRAATGTILLAGEPGIGKTRLLAEAGRDAYARGATVLYGRCYEEPVAPYEPFAEALGAETFAALLDQAGDRWRLFEAVGARLQGTVVALDDLHWADAGTIRLFTHLVRRGQVVLGAYRDSEVPPGLADALADLRRDGLVERIGLRGLSAAEVEQLGGNAKLAAETGGNPFFVAEALRHGGPVTEGVKDLIGRRLARLHDDTRTVLGLAAVAGREFDLTLLEAVVQLDVLAALEEACAAQLVREERPGGYTFEHALVREALYESIGLTRRARTHLALAEALETLPGRSAAERAHHRLEAGDPSAALEAAAEAMRALAYEDAAAFCTRAIALEGRAAGKAAAAGQTRLAALHLALGHARLRTGEDAREAFATAADHARERRDAELLAQAALGFSGLGVTIIAVDEEAVALLEEALAAIGEDDPLRARLLARLAIETYYACTPAQRKALGDEAVRLADADSRLDALNARHAALWSAEYLDERLATARELHVLAITRGDTEMELQALNWLVTDLLEAGELEEMRATVAAHEALAQRLRLPAYTWWGPLWRSTLAIIEGRFADAEALIATLDRRDPNARLYAEIQGFAIALHQERFAKLSTGAPMERERGRPAEYGYRAGYAWILAGQGEHEGAREQLDWLAADDFARLGDDMNRLAALAEMAQAMTILEDPTHAAGVLERLAPYADRYIANGRGAAGYGSAAHHIATLTALLGEPAEAAFEEALRRNAALGCRPWLERTRAQFARLK